MPGMERWIRDWRCMSASEVDEFLSFNMRNIHSGTMYVDDYYYQAYINKYFNGLNNATFRPEKVYALAPHEAGEGAEHAFARVDGLGKFVYSNLRAPRQLLAIDGRKAKRAADASKAGGKRGGGKGPQTSGAVAAAIAAGKAPAGKAPAKAKADDDDDGNEFDDVVFAPAPAPGPDSPEAAPDSGLQHDRQVAARKVMEDCNYQLLDVDDIDCILSAEAATAPGGKAPAGPSAAASDLTYMLQRRQLLMDTIVHTMCLDDAPCPPPTASDAVFHFLMTYAKGRKLVARVLQRLVPRVRAAAGTPSHGRGLLFAALRNVRALFDGNVLAAPADGVVLSEEGHLVEAASGVAAAAAESLRRVTRPEDLLQCFEALAASDVVSESDAGVGHAQDQGQQGLLPLLLLSHVYQPLDGAAWLGTLLVALLERAVQLGVATCDATRAAFQPRFDALFARMLVHLASLCGLMAQARAAGDGIDVEEAVQSLRALAAPHVLHAMLTLCTPEQESQLVLLLQQIVG